MNKEEKKKQVDRQIRDIAEKAKKVLGRDITLLAHSLGVNLEHAVRFTPVAKTCKAIREQKKLSIKQAANKIKVPQHIIKEIEGTSVPNISVSALRKYVECLGIKESFETWEKDNVDVLMSFKK
jgi:ribosome-binding protein aMBF1 (putative translation factor)